MLIEKNIPMPVTSGLNEAERLERQAKVAAMEIGESFIVKKAKSAHGAAISAAQIAFRSGKKMQFTAAPEGDGFRVWRKS